MDPFMSNFNVALRPHLNPRPKLADLHIKVHKQVSTLDLHPMSNRSQLYVKLMITFLPYHIIRNITQWSVNSETLHVLKKSDSFYAHIACTLPEYASMQTTLIYL